MKWLNGYKIRLVLFGFVAAIVLGGGSAYADFTFGRATNLGPVVNSSANDQTLNITADGLSLYFSSDRPGGYGSLDLYVATRESTDDDWGPAVNLGPTVNTPSLEGHGCISADGLALYFCSNRPGGFGSYDLWVATRETTEDDWGTPVNLGPTVNSSTYTMESSISPDGLTLWFESSRPGGLGGGDVWMTTRPTISDPWRPPVNLGPPVNSAVDDGDPSISDDGRILFFTSGRPGGYGNYDLWVSTRKTTDDKWGTTVNLGRSVNSTDNELGANISADGRTLYFNSSRAGGYGGYDLWQAPIIPVVDFNGDGIVDFKDFSKLAQYWGQNESSVDMGPMPWGDGRVDIQDLAVLAEYWLKEPGQAWGPTPADGATNQARSILYWNAGETANAHDVYFGTDRTAVENADTSSPLYIDQVVETPGVQPCSTKAVTLQQASKTYYWRIDEVEADGITIHKGDVWSFTTAPFKAHTPIPADGATNQPKSILRWNAGETANAHDVYFGSDETAVTNATPDSPEYIEQTNQLYSSIVSGLQLPMTTYYWRIDEVVDETTVIKGDIWSFSTAGLKAYNPSPADNELLVDPNVVLSWGAGSGAVKGHMVYFSTSFADVNNAATASTTKPPYQKSLAAATTYWDPSPGSTSLAFNTTYYWRIDEVESTSPKIYHKGNVWRFTTVPYIPITDPTLLGQWKLDEGSGVTVLDWSGHNRHGTINGGATYATGVFDKALNLDGIDDWVSVGNRILYVDGVEVVRGTQDAVAPSGGGLHIGAGKNLDAGSFWSSLIDDVRIYNRAVSP